MIRICILNLKVQMTFEHDFHIEIFRGQNLYFIKKNIIFYMDEKSLVLNDAKIIRSTNFLCPSKK
jgi:hypothetical protein